jgi:hypothetical protein
MENFNLKKYLAEGILLQEETLDESLLGKGVLAALLLTMGTTWAQLKPELKAKIDSIQKVDNLNPQEKRAEITKIVKMNREEITGKHRADFLKSMAAAGFTDEDKYKSYLTKLSKKSDVGQSGLEGSDNKKGGSCGAASSLQKALNSK